MGKKTYLEHEEAQEDAIALAVALRKIVDSMPPGADRDVIDEAAVFLGAIADPDNPPMTEAEMAKLRPAIVR